MARQQSRDQKRQQKKARRAAAKGKAKPFRLDPKLPQTRAEVEAAIQDQIAVMSASSVPLSQTEHLPNGDKRVHLEPPLAHMLRLQQQLFRIAFGREPGEGDPLFWDHSREAEGPQPLEEGELTADVTKAIITAKLPPELAYAYGMTGRMVTETNRHNLTEEELEEWEDTLEDFREQSATGIPPLAPDELVPAWLKMNDIFVKTGQTLQKREQSVQMMRIALAESLGSVERAEIAMRRIHAFVQLAEEGHVEKSPEGYPEDAVAAAACTPLDPEGNFDMEEFELRRTWFESV